MLPIRRIGGSPLGTTPAQVPLDIQKQIETAPYTQGPMDLVQPGTIGNQGDVAEVPRVTVQEQPVPNDFGQSDLTGVVTPIEYQDQVDTERQYQEDRLAEPTSLPNFATPDDAFQTMAAAKEQLGQQYGLSELDKLQRPIYRNNEGAEAVALSKHAEDFSQSLFNGTGIYANPTVAEEANRYYGSKDPSMQSIQSGLLLASAGVFSNVKQRTYEKNLGDADLKNNGIDLDTLLMDFGAEPTENTKSDEERKQQWAEMQSNVRADPNAQPIIQGMLSDYQNKIGSAFSKGTRPGGAYTRDVAPKELAAAEMFQRFSEGYFELGRNKKGIYYPILTNKGEDMLKDTMHAASIHDVELRLMNINEPVIRSQTVPPVNNLMIANKTNSFLPNGKIVTEAKDIIKRGMDLQVAVPSRVNLNTFKLLDQMASIAFPYPKNADGSGVSQAVLSLSPLVFNAAGDLVQNNLPSLMGLNAPVSSGPTFTVEHAYSNTPYSHTIADLSMAKVAEKYKELISNGIEPAKANQIIAEINDQKITQVYKHLNDYLGGNANKAAYWSTLKQSPTTGRVFPTATDDNKMNHSGTIRPGSEFAIKHNAVIKTGAAQTFAQVKSQANRVYDVSGVTGIGIGAKIQKNLWALSREDRVLMDAMYQLGKTAADFKLGSFRVEGNRPTPNDYIQAMNMDTLRELAMFGNRFKTWTEGGLPKTEDEAKGLLPPGFNSLSEFFEKKEWAPRINNAIMASDLYEAIKQGRGVVQCAAQIETDASQSNAFIISSLIGDLKVANILGAYIGGDAAFKKDREEYRDLRNLVASSIDDDIDLALRGPDESIKASELKEFFKTARGSIGLAFDKMYARGIVVAGLYGKNAQFLFTEVETMLQSIAASGSPADISSLERLYHNRQEMIEDISSVYAQSMSKHLANLQGYQRVASSIATVKSLFNGSSIIKSAGNIEIDVGTSYATHRDSELNTLAEAAGMPDEVAAMSGRAFGISAPDSAGANLAELAALKDRLAELNLNIPDALDMLTKESHAGTKFRKQLPVVLIQSLDAFMQFASTVYANQGRPEGEPPLNVYGIHDAQMTAPGSTLLMYNAYNNITPYLVAENSEPIFKSLKASMKEDRERALGSADGKVQSAVERAGKATIGDHGAYPAMGGYFDRMYTNARMVSRDKKRERKSLMPEYDAMREEMTNKILDLAVSFGWKPPTQRNALDREKMEVTPRQFKALSILAIHSEGWKTPEERTFPELEDIARKHKTNFLMRNFKQAEKFDANNKTFISQMRSNRNQIVNSK